MDSSFANITMEFQPTSLTLSHFFFPLDPTQQHAKRNKETEAEKEQQKQQQNCEPQSLLTFRTWDAEKSSNRIENKIKFSNEFPGG